jgi:hypothetical protein
MGSLRFFQRLLAGWVCLSIHLAVATPLPALLTAVAAIVDGEHRVGWVVDGNTTRIVLGHGEERHPPVAHHCGLCRAMVAFSDDPESLDHVLSFRSKPPESAGPSQLDRAVPHRWCTLPRKEWILSLPPTVLSTRRITGSPPASPPRDSAFVVSSTVRLV